MSKKKLPPALDRDTVLFQSNGNDVTAGDIASQVTCAGCNTKDIEGIGVFIPSPEQYRALALVDGPTRTYFYGVCTVCRETKGLAQLAESVEAKLFGRLSAGD